MRNVITKFSIAFALFTLVFMVGTCYVNKTPKPEPIPIDTILFHSYKEKVDALQATYEKQISVLAKSKDSLQILAKGNKKTMAVLRFQSGRLETQLKATLQNSDSSLASDSLKTSAFDYIAVQNERDSLCLESINTLEIIACKQDSIIEFQSKEKDNWKDLQKQNELREQYLTEQLNIAFKQQRKITVRNKFCAGALVLITGFAGALLINQTVK